MYCPSCGAEVTTDAQMCPVCGAPIDPDIQQVQSVQNNSVSDEMDAQKNKGMAVLSYIGLLFLIPLLAAKDSGFARFHVNQGLVLFLLEILCGVLMAIPVLGWILGIVGYAGALVIGVIGILNAIRGEKKELPIIGKIQIIK